MNQRTMESLYRLIYTLERGFDLRSRLGLRLMVKSTPAPRDIYCVIPLTEEDIADSMGPRGQHAFARFLEKDPFTSDDAKQ